jgi:hypothetical protein
MRNERHFSPIVICVLLSATAWAQQKSTAQPTQQSPLMTVPAGTHLMLGLVRPLSFKKSKAGTPVYLQVTFPVTIGPQMAIPAGAYVQGTIDKVVKRNRTKEVMEFKMRSATVIFSTGYTVSLGGALDVAPIDASAAPPALPGSTVPVLAAVGGSAPALAPLPSMGNGARNAVIGLGIAGAAAGIIVAAIGYHHNDIEMDAGTPVEIVLQSPLLLERDRVQAAVQQYSAQNGAPQIVKPPSKPKLCYDPGTPGSPDVVIPGTPGSPGVGNVPGTPGTPDVVIPGTPGTPGSYHPCHQ